jgi:hypothetical protein
MHVMHDSTLWRLQEHVDIRDQITKSRFPSTDELRPLVAEMIRRIVANGRDQPVPKLRCRNALVSWYLFLHLHAVARHACHAKRAALGCECTIDDD